jgi:hypothetical protein
MKICIVVDGSNHCYATTMAELAACLPQHDILRISSEEYLKDEALPEQFDLIYFRGWWGRLRRPLNTPWIPTITTDGPAAEARLVRSELMRNLMMRAIVVQCQSVMDVAVQLRFPAIAMIPNGVNVETYRPGSAPEMTVGLAARMTCPDRERLKGKELLIEAAHLSGLPASIANGLPHDEMPDWYRTLWVYCQPSDREGCSNSLNEAMASGLPCLICEGVGYHGEMCRDAREHPEGEVLFVERDPEDIADALVQLREYPDLHARLARNARRFAEDHAWPLVAMRFDSLFDWAANGSMLGVNRQE